MDITVSKRWSHRTAALVAMMLLMTAVAAGCGGGRHHRKSAHPDLIIQKTASYENWERIRNQMSRECTIDTSVPYWIKKFVPGSYDAVVLTDTIPPDTPAGVLTLTIKDARGMPAGIYSGRKYITVEGKLTRNGIVIGSFIAHRASGWGHSKSILKVPKLSGRHASTCQLLYQCAESMGKDVGKWLKEPTMDARLGTAPDLGDQEEQPEQ